MSDRLDRELQKLMVKVMAMAPEPPPFPQAATKRPRSRLGNVNVGWSGWKIAFAAGWLLIVLIAVPILWLNRDGSSPTPPATVTSPPPTPSDTSTTTTRPPDEPQPTAAVSCTLTAPADGGIESTTRDLAVVVGAGDEITVGAYTASFEVVDGYAPEGIEGLGLLVDVSGPIEPEDQNPDLPDGVIMRVVGGIFPDPEPGQEQVGANASDGVSFLCVGADSSSVPTAADPELLTVAPPLTGPPSQSPEDAARDGVVPELAAVPFDVRVDPIVTVGSDNGIWWLSRPGGDLEGLPGGCLLGDPGGLYGRDYICVAEYAELLRMGWQGGDRVIERAYPLPGFPAQTLQLTEDAIYCARQGDGGLPDSMVCRVDFATGEFTLRVFPSVIDSGYQPPDPDQFIPDTWTMDAPMGSVLFSNMAVTARGLGVSGHDGWALLDPITLEVIELFDLGEQNGICSTTGLDLDLVAQPGLPAAVAATRQAIFEAAMACDYDGLKAIADAGSRFFEASLDGGDVSYYREAESRGEPALAYMARLVNLPYAVGTDDEGSYYIWPSAVNLESPYGDGIPDADYQALLELYTVEQLEGMFDGIGGYVGWRHSIFEDGEWRLFLAGD